MVIYFGFSFPNNSSLKTNILSLSSKNGITNLGWSPSRLGNLFGTKVLTHSKNFEQEIVHDENDLIFVCSLKISLQGDDAPMLKL